MPGRPAVLAVDGGASKADVALVTGTGDVIGATRRFGQTNVGVSMAGSLAVIGEAIGAAAREAGLDAGGGWVASTGVFCLAGADFPVDDRRIARTFAEQGWCRDLVVRNDTFAVLRAGTDRGWGVAVVCGTGMNCVGLAPDGRAVRFPALGELSGDWAAGGEWVGRRALGAALRARDGRGRRTVLERSVPEFFGLARPRSVMEAVHRGHLDDDRLTELTPLVFAAAAEGDAAAWTILAVQADEVAAWALAALRRLGLLSSSADVVLGGGMFRADHAPFIERIEGVIAAEAPTARVRRLESPPVVGAALLGLDETGASARAAARLRGSLSFDRLDGPSGGRSGRGGR